MPDSEQTQRTLIIDAIERLGLLQVEFARSMGKLDLLLEDRTKASDHRRQIHEEINDLKNRLAVETAALREKIVGLDAVTERFEKLEVVVLSLDRDRQRAKGVVWALRFLWALVGGAAGAALTRIMSQH